MASALAALAISVSAATGQPAAPEALKGAAVGVEPASAASGTPAPVEHVVVILQENHSFDNLLGQLCIEEHRACSAASSGQTEHGTTIPLSQASDVVPEVRHNQRSQLLAMDNGKMDGWENIEGCKENQCYTQYYPSQIPSLAAMAHAGAISDAFFSRDIVPSWGGHVDFFAQTLDGFVGDNPVHLESAPPPGPGWGCDSNLDARWFAPNGNWHYEPSCIPGANGQGAYRPTPVRYVPTIADRLEAAGRTWRIYGSVNTQEGSYKWNICASFAECLYGPQKNNEYPASQLISDASTGALPNFAIATPSNGVAGATSQHNGDSMMVGDNSLGEEVSAIQHGPDGPSTTIFIYYDDCGCFYDHVTPPAGLGIRLPLVIVSPYAKPGYTDHNVATNSSILAYMEHLFGVQPLNERDGTAYDFRESFNYSQPPSAPFTFHPSPVPAASRHLAAVQREGT